MTNVTRSYLRDTEQFLAIALAAEKVLPARGTARLQPAAQPRRKAQPERKAGGIKRALRGIFGGEL